jgi:ABC-type uncharacterized transport system substrate-binding protein
MTDPVEGEKEVLLQVRKKLLWRLVVGLLLMMSASLPSDAASLKKVLAVMSYHDGMSWEDDIREGIEEELKGTCEIRYVYLNTKNDYAGGPDKAREAWRAFQEFKPDGVLAADDDAQTMFVVPYLADKSKTPVVFCGVNADPDRYGYPASNVTGILERAHFRESIAFLQQLMPAARSFAFMTNDNPTGRGYDEQITRELSSYPVSTHSVHLVKTLAEAVTVATEMARRYDALFLIAMEGLVAPDGRPLAEKESFRVLSHAFGKPVIGINEFNIRWGLLCGVVKTGQEQGSTAAKMLLEAMDGIPLSAIPITCNVYGKRVLNVSVMKSLGIVPKPVLLVGTELVESEE